MLPGPFHLCQPDECGVDGDHEYSITESKATPHSTAPITAAAHNIQVGTRILPSALKEQRTTL